MVKKKIIDGVQYSIAAIIFKKEKTLMFKREGKIWERGWEFVKGAMHIGESEEEGVYREVNEEAGIKVKIIGKLPKVYFDYKPFRGGTLKILGMIYVCEYTDGEIRLGEPEHTSYKWMNLEEALSKVWIRNGQEMIKNAYTIYKSCA